MKDASQRSLFGRNLRRFRKAKHFTQAQLADLVGIDRVIVAVYETRPTEPSVGIAVRLANALGVSVYDLVAEDREPATDFSNIDPRTLRKAMEIAMLSSEARAKVYRFVNQLRKSDNSGKQPPEPPPS